MKIRNAIPPIALSALLITNVYAQNDASPNNSSDPVVQKNTNQLEASKAGKVQKQLKHRREGEKYTAYPAC